jgi:hypothetical protein
MRSRLPIALLIPTDERCHGLRTWAAFVVALALAAGLAGCTSNAATPMAPPPAAPSPPPAVAPLHLHATVFLPPSQGQDPERTEVAFPVNASGESLVATVHLGSRYAVDLPTTTAEVTVRLVGPANETLAKAVLHAGTADATLKAAANATGTHKLVLLSYGGSDGSSMGDYVTYDLQASAAGSR